MQLGGLSPNRVSLCLVNNTVVCGLVSPSVELFVVDMAASIV